MVFNMDSIDYYYKPGLNKMETALVDIFLISYSHVMLTNITHSVEDNRQSENLRIYTDGNLPTAPTES